MKKISLTQNQFTLVDDSDFDWLNQWKWNATWNPHTKSFYAVRGIYLGGGRKNSKTTSIKMHRLIINVSKNKQVDHINHDTLDNRRKNLRICTRAENSMNRKLNINNTSGYKGISWNKPTKKWMAQIRKNGIGIHLGLFANIYQAAKAYDQAAKKLFGEFAKLNFE